MSKEWIARLSFLALIASGIVSGIWDNRAVIRWLAAYT